MTVASHGEPLPRVSSALVTMAAMASSAVNFSPRQERDTCSLSDVSA